VLALLALARGKVVTVDALLEGAWPGDGPASGARALQTAVSRLRAALGSLGEIRAEGAGYSLTLAPGMLDIETAESLPPADALALWRGPALEEFADLVAFTPERRRLEEWRCSLVELHGDALATAGRSDEIATEWERHVGIAPLRPRLWAQLITALAVLGRQADALRAYQRARDAFGEAGLEPPAELVALERQVASGVSLAPSGTSEVTFLFTDVVGSTQRWESNAPAMAAALAIHDREIAGAVSGHGGRVLKTKGEGDSTVSVFATPADALAAAADAQRALELPVRMAVHVGTAEARDGDYFGPTLNRAARLRAIAHGGQIICSRAAAEAAEKRLADGLGLIDLGTHQLKDLAEPERVFQLVADGLAAEFPALLSLSAAHTNLPAQLTSFIGRETELERVAELLGASRLVTLTGAGGSGKTRLALQAAADAVEEHPGGVWLAELAPIADPTHVANAVAGAVRATVAPGASAADAAARAIADNEALLVVDNCEHVIDAAAAMVTQLLASCPNLRVLATSRERLRVAGETAWPVPTLDVSDDVASEAVRLFVDRAREADPDFAFDESNRADVIDVCKRVDAIPLAIELAAARVRTLPPAELVRRLQSHRQVLARGDRTALPRHQSLQATIDWSHSLLSDEERVALRRLSVFRGGCTLEMAERVVAGDDIDEFEVVDALEGLVDKSLVSLTDGRYRMLETVREYALDKLAQAGEADAWVRLQAQEIMRWAADKRQLRSGPSQVDIVLEGLAEHDNIAAAVTWALTEEPAMAGRMLGDIFILWTVVPGSGEHVDWFRRLLNFADLLERDDQVRALTGIGRILGYVGDERGIECAERAVAVARQLDDQLELAESLAFLGPLYRIWDRHEEAYRCVEEARRILEVRPDPFVSPLLGTWGAWPFFESGHEEVGVAVVIEGLRVAREAGNIYLANDDLPLAFPDAPWPDQLPDRAPRPANALDVGLSTESLIMDQAYEAALAGDFDASNALLEQALAGPEVHHRARLGNSMALAEGYTIRGRPDDAWELLRPYLDGEMTRTDTDEMMIRSQAVVIRRDLGDTRGAAEHARIVLRWLRAGNDARGWWSEPASAFAGRILMAVATLPDLPAGDRARLMEIGIAMHGGFDDSPMRFATWLLALEHTPAPARLTDDEAAAIRAMEVTEATDYAFVGDFEGFFDRLLADPGADVK
jgi:predicted ATPase/class 3 adenylate cyclase